MNRDVSAYIRELLFSHDCVIIPDFGAFIGNYVAARVDREAGLFFPPARKITFNRHLVNNDGLLIGFISARTGIGYGEARDLVAAFTSDLQKRLSGGERVIAEHIGTFWINHEGMLIFETDSEANYLLTSFGLDTFHRQPVKDYNVRMKVLEHHAAHPVIQPSVRRLLTRAAVAIPLLVALALVPFNTHLFKGKISESSMNPLATAELQYNRELTDSALLPESEESVAEAVIEQPAQVTVTVQSQYRYMLITGSFKSEDNVLGMVEALRNKGYDPEVAAGPDGFMRVSVASFSSLDQAETALRELDDIYPETWICRTK